jgi:hypothetical protein
MVKRWLVKKEPGWQRNWVVNAVGAVVTGIVLVVIIVTKFLLGAWIVCLLIPLVITMFLTIHRHYNQVRQELDADVPVTPSQIRHTIIVPLADLNRVAIQTLAYARSLANNVTAVHIADDEEDAEQFREKWQAWGNKVPLVVIESPYRSVINPLLRYIDAIDRSSKNDTVTVILPEFVTAHWWENLLHNQTALRLKAALLFRPGTIVTSVPYHPRTPENRDIRAV